jgi:hypothetical protein
MSENERKLSSSQQEQIDSINKEVDFRKKIEEELLKNESMQEYFNGFEPSSAQSFLKSYISSKSLWHRFGEFFISQHDRHDLRWIEDANTHLEIIQQKKLFDAKCLWRSEKIELPGIEICYDLEIWGDRVLNCPFIDPITEEDIELYQEFLLSESTDLAGAFDCDNIGTEYYEDIIEAYQNDTDSAINFPEWYDFYNNRKGTAVYMTFPDVRGKKETFYRDIYRERVREEQENKPVTIRDTRPYLSHYERETMDYFVETFEDKLTKQYYRAYQWNRRNTDDEEGLEFVLSLLHSADEYVAVEPHYDWKEALKKAANKYMAKKIAETLPEAFAQYQLNRSMNISSPVSRGVHSDQNRDNYMSAILKGRKLNGDPEDLNF